MDSHDRAMRERPEANHWISVTETWRMALFVLALLLLELFGAMFSASGSGVLE